MATYVSAVGLECPPSVLRLSSVCPPSVLAVAHALIILQAQALVAGVGSLRCNGSALDAVTQHSHRNG